jgi:adenosylcobinamide-GDP ribazoletransferase
MPTGTNMLAKPWFDDFLGCIAFLTRIPVRAAEATRPLAEMAWAFPLVGVVVGLAGAVAYALADALGLPSVLAAVLAVAAMVAVTGGLHEDGLADTLDGFGGGRDRESKLAIMRDSRIGAFGVIALILVLLARVAAVALLGEAGRAADGLIAAGAVSRAGLVFLMAWIPSARADGLSAAAGRPDNGTLVLAAAFAAAVAVLAAGIVAWLWPTLAAAAALAAVAWLARRQIGGQTGDVLGAAQQVAEIAMLLALVALWSNA